MKRGHEDGQQMPASGGSPMAASQRAGVLRACTYAAGSDAHAEQRRAASGTAVRQCGHGFAVTAASSLRWNRII